MLTFAAILRATRQLGAYGDGRGRRRPALPSRMPADPGAEDGKAGATDLVRRWDDARGEFAYGPPRRDGDPTGG